MPGSRPPPAAPAPPAGSPAAEALEQPDRPAFDHHRVLGDIVIDTRITVSLSDQR
jgi:hypothetical protein